MTTSDPIRPEEPVTRSFTLDIYAGDRAGEERREFLACGRPEAYGVEEGESFLANKTSCQA